MSISLNISTFALTMKHSLFILISLLLLSACNGIDLGVYDVDEVTVTSQTESTPVVVVVKDSIVTGEIYIDASSDTSWYYIDLHAIHDEIVDSGKITETFPAYSIPLEATDNWDGKSGIFFYWYDVFNKGVSVHHKSDDTQYKTYGFSDIHTAPQPEPASWDFAIHRDNVRTNGGAAYETDIQDIAQTADKATYASMPFTEDEWNETDVWTIRDYMLTGNVGNQAIAINSVLSNWLSLKIPPFPPSFIYDNNVFILRMKDGKYAALRLKDYVNAKTGTKCCMTIEFKYPLL